MIIRWTIALGAALVSLAGHPVAARAVTGTPFDFTGVRREGKIHLSCSGATIRAHGLLDQTARSVSGTFTRRGRNRVHHGTFTLTEQPPA
jgi:hypothetical protein